MATTTSFAPHTNASHFLFAALEEVTNHGSNTRVELDGLGRQCFVVGKVLWSHCLCTYDAPSHQLTGLCGATMLKDFVGSLDTPNYGGRCYN